MENFHPKNPLTFRTKDGSLTRMSDIIKSHTPQLAHGYSFWVNPLLSSGHTQTAYTALNKFESSDMIHYKRELITVEDKTYTVEGEEVRYDRWKGKSTFTVDYVDKGPVTTGPVKEPVVTGDPVKSGPVKSGPVKSGPLVSGDPLVTEPLVSGDPLEHKPPSQGPTLPPRTRYINPDETVFSDSRPLLIALHGLSGGSFESYVRSLLSQVTGPEVDFDAVVINSRGCAHHTITSPQLFCGLWTNDVRYFINEHVKKRWPDKKVFLVGFLLGGAIAANYIGQEKDDIYPQIKGAFILGSPWDFSDSSYVLRESLLGDRIYSPVMSQNLLKLLKTHQAEFVNDNVVKAYNADPTNFNLATLKDFDDSFTCKLFGFNTSFEYYRHASPNQRLFKFRVPTVIIGSKDDPVCGIRSLPMEESRINPYVLVITTTVGGHLGWFDYKLGRWYAEPVARLMKQLAEVEVEGEVELPLDVDEVWKHDRLV